MGFSWKQHVYGFLFGGHPQRFWITYWHFEYLAQHFLGCLGVMKLQNFYPVFFKFSNFYYVIIIFPGEVWRVGGEHGKCTYSLPGKKILQSRLKTPFAVYVMEILFWQKKLQKIALFYYLFYQVAFTHRNWRFRDKLEINWMVFFVYMDRLSL